MVQIAFWSLSLWSYKQLDNLIKNISTFTERSKGKIRFKFFDYRCRLSEISYFMVFYKVDVSYALSKFNDSDNNISSEALKISMLKSFFKAKTNQMR